MVTSMYCFGTYHQEAEHDGIRYHNKKLLTELWPILGKRQTEKQKRKAQQQNTPFKGIPSLIYFFYLAPNSYSFNGYPIVHSALNPSIDQSINEMIAFMIQSLSYHVSTLLHHLGDTSHPSLSKVTLKQQRNEFLIMSMEQNSYYELEFSLEFAKRVERMIIVRNRRSQNGVASLFHTVKLHQLTEEKLIIPSMGLRKQIFL